MYEFWKCIIKDCDLKGNIITGCKAFCGSLGMEILLKQMRKNSILSYSFTYQLFCVHVNNIQSIVLKLKDL